MAEERMSISHEELSGVHSRIDKVEGSLEKFTTETFPQFAAALGTSISEKFDNFAQRTERTRPDIFKVGGTVFAAVGLCVTLLGGYGKLALDQNTANISRLEHVQEGLSAAQDTATENLRKAISATNASFEAKLDTLVQRTMPYNEVKLRTETNASAIGGVQKYLYEDDKVLRKDVFEEYSKRIDENQRNLLEAFRRFVDKTTDAFTDIRNKQVSRSEHEYHWANEDKSQAQIQGQMDSLRRDFGATYSVGDQLKSLQQQLNQQQGVITQLLATLPPTQREGK